MATMNTMMYPLALLLSIVFMGSTVVYGVSVCDEVDVVSLLDTASILQNEAEIISLIDSIILNGSSDGESDHFYFLFGQHLDESVGINCHREGGGILKHLHAFHHFDEEPFVEDPYVNISEFYQIISWTAFRLESAINVYTGNGLRKWSFSSRRRARPPFKRRDIMATLDCIAASNGLTQTPSRSVSCCS